MDAMTGRGELRDRGLVAAFYGRGGLVDGRMLWSTEAWTAADWGGLGDWRTQRTMESWTGRTAADGADWGGWGRTGVDGADWNGVD